MQEKIVEYRTLEGEVEGLQGVDLEVAEREMVTGCVRSIDDLHALADTVLELERQGQDIVDLPRAARESFMTGFPASIEDVMDETLAAALRLAR